MQCRFADSAPQEAGGGGAADASPPVRPRPRPGRGPAGGRHHPALLRLHAHLLQQLRLPGRLLGAVLVRPQAA